MSNIKTWLIENGFTDPVEQLMYPAQGYVRAVRELERKITHATEYDETLPLMIKKLEDIREDFNSEMDSIEQIRIDAKGE